MAKKPQTQGENYQIERGPPVHMEILNKVNDFARRSVCKILSNDGSTGSGFLAWLPVASAQKQVMCGIFTNNHVLPRPEICAQENIIFRFEGLEDIDAINLKPEFMGFTWTNKDIDASFIEISIEKALNWIGKGASFLNVEPFRKDEQIIVAQHPKGGKMSVDYGKIFKEETDSFLHSAATDVGSSGSPILSLNGSVVGIHKGFDKSTENKSNIGVNLNRAVNFIAAEYGNRFTKTETTGYNSQTSSFYWLIVI